MIVISGVLGTSELLMTFIWLSVVSICHILLVAWIPTTTTTTTVLCPFVRDYYDKPAPEETLTHPPS